jgi:hypothetical protein
MVLSMSMLSFIFVIVCGLFEWKKICACFFLSCVYICIAVGDPVIKRGGFGIPLTSLAPPHFCDCPKPGPIFPTSYVVIFFQFSEVN